MPARVISHIIICRMKFEFFPRFYAATADSDSLSLLFDALFIRATLCDAFLSCLDSDLYFIPVTDNSTFDRYHLHQGARDAPFVCIR